MKLLFDQNLAPSVVSALVDIYPGSRHVRDLGLQSADDDVIWKFAIDQGFAIVSKDSDFHQRSFLWGHPPKVIWIRKGHCSTREIIDLLRSRTADLLAFDQDPDGSFLAIF